MKDEPKKLIADAYYFVKNTESELVCDQWLGDRWGEAKTPNTKEETKSITLINSSKYSYTEKVGDNMVSYGFDKMEELRNFALHHNQAAMKNTIKE